MRSFGTTPLVDYPAHDLAWLSGRWKGNHGDDIVEEQWSEPAAGTLMAMFRWLRGGSILFYELIVIEQEDHKLVMRIKHFNPGLLGWEDQDHSVCFDLVQVEGQQAIFLQRQTDESVWLVYEREKEDQLLAYFVRSGQETRPNETFRYDLI